MGIIRKTVSSVLNRVKPSTKDDISQEVRDTNGSVGVEGYDGFLFTTRLGKNLLQPIRHYGRVSDTIIRSLYHRSSQIRSCVDGIVGEMSGRNPRIIPADENYPELVIKVIETFFRKVNRKKDNIRRVVTRATRDLLVHDRFFIEKVRNRKGDLVELYVRDPIYMIIDKDTNGVITGYRQVIQNKITNFEPNDIIYGCLNPCSYDDYGIPIIEGIVDETCSLILANYNISDILANDSIPPGVLVLGEIGDAAYKKLKNDLSKKEERTKLKVLRNVENADWIAFDRPLNENQVDYLLGRLDDIVSKAFQMPTKKEVASRTGAEVSHRITLSRLITPIIKIWEDVITEDILINEFELEGLRFKLLKETSIDPQEAVEKARAIKLLANGILTINECREMLDFGVVKGGDKRFTILGNEVIFYDDETGMPERAPDFKQEFGGANTSSNNTNTDNQDTTGT